MLPLNDLFVMALMTIIIIVGVYQFYFLTQDHMLKSARRFSTRFDDKIPFQPGWVWIYSGLYYPMIVAIILTMDDMRHYNLTVMSFIFLLLMQMICFRYYPVETPPKWREFGDRTGLNIAFMRLVQKYDDNTNCFPSMHASVDTDRPPHDEQRAVVGAMAACVPTAHRHRRAVHQAALLYRPDSRCSARLDRLADPSLVHRLTTVGYTAVLGGIMCSLTCLVLVSTQAMR